MKPASRERVDPVEFACGGSLVGMVLFALYDTYVVTADAVVDGSDFSHFFVSMAIFVACGASMFAAAAGLWNRRLRSAPSGLLQDEWIREPSREGTGHFNDVIITVRCHPPTIPAQPGRPTTHESKSDVVSHG